MANSQSRPAGRRKSAKRYDVACRSSLEIIIESGDKAYLFFVGRSEVAGEQAFAPFVVFFQCVVQPHISAPTSTGGTDQGFVLAFETQRQLLGGQMLQHAPDRRPAGGNQRHLVSLQVTERTANRLLGGQLTGL